MEQFFATRSLTTNEFPPLLHEIPEPPKELFLRGKLPSPHMKLLTVVGSRNYSDYGKHVVEYLIEGLRGYPIAIISGLARGMDTLAHEAALKTGLFTLAVPGSGIDDTVIYPRQNVHLAHRILDSGGGILSEYKPYFYATKWSFPRRNRIMAGMAHATLVIEASEKSGTLITARLAVDYNRELLAVPGNIFGENSKGPHQFIKLGATPATAPKDILEALNITVDETNKQMERFLPPEGIESQVLFVLTSPTDRDTLIRTLTLNTQEANILFMEMELKGLIHESNGVFYKT